jgi:hypothetical protein
LQLKQLQLKVLGKDVQVANKTFQTFNDVLVWVNTHLPIHFYGLFVDGFLIFEFFTVSHIDAETTYYSQGFTSSFNT